MTVTLSSTASGAGSARRRLRFGHALLHEQPPPKAAVPQESIQRTLITGEHDVARAGSHRPAHALEAALAVVLDRGDQVNLLNERAMPYDAIQALHAS